jgi:hypothetical protein
MAYYFAAYLKDAAFQPIKMIDWRVCPAYEEYTTCG